MIDASNILDRIIALTFTRHANLYREDFLKEIGAEPNADEDETVIKARFSLINASTKELLKANDKIKLITQTLELAIKGENYGK